MKRSAVAVLLVLTAALLVAGCGGGSGSTPTYPEGEHNEEITGPPGGGAPKATSPNAPAGSKVVSCGGSAQLRATAVGCATARTTLDDWEGSGACALSSGDSRGSCSLGAFRCQEVKVGQGVSVSCAGPDGDVSFVKPAG